MAASTGAALGGDVPDAHRRAALALLDELARRDPTGQAVARAGDVEELARVAAGSLVGAAEVWDDHLGGFYDAEGVRHLLGRAGRAISRQAVSKRRGLLALTTGSGRVVYPRFQFRGRGVLPGLGEVLAALPEPLVSRWAVASWLVSPQADLDGERPVDLLGDGHVAAVAVAARHWADALAA